MHSVTLKSSCCDGTESVDVQVEGDKRWVQIKRTRCESCNLVLIEIDCVETGKGASTQLSRYCGKLILPENYLTKRTDSIDCKRIKDRANAAISQSLIKAVERQSSAITRVGTAARSNQVCSRTNGSLTSCQTRNQQQLNKNQMLKCLKIGLINVK